MIPRGTPDIGWIDLLAGLRDCLAPPPEGAARALAEAAMGHTGALACLSVRSGLDLTLQALALPAGSEVLVSAVTIPGMIQVLGHHGLVAVPVDLDMERLSLDTSSLERALTPRTRAVLVAHLFGCQMDLSPTAALARSHGLLLLEDCAQAYDGRYAGHPHSDVAMFSFGPIKTSTALGGAILRFRDPALLARARAIQAAYPAQPLSPYLRRTLLFLGLKAVARPAPFAALVALCRLGGRSHDALITGLLRGFPGGDLIARLRHRPCAPLLAMLARRLRCPPAAAVARRTAQARAMIAALSERLIPGSLADLHTHWALPLASADPEVLARLLWALGADASRSASSLYVVAPPPGRQEATRAAAVMGRLLYLPLHPALDDAAIWRLARAISAFERDRVITLAQR
jgi:dTDP-4-amino-4,6-dideoxygalactose transaminase